MRKAFSAVGVLLLAVLVAVLATARGADAASAIMKVFVTNDADHPVPTRAVGTTDVSGSVSVSDLPAWQGTPYLKYALNTNVEFEECDSYAIPEGKILFVERVVADFDMPTGESGTAAVRLTPLGEENAIKIPIPATQGGLVGQVDGNRTDIAGAIDIGQPVTEIRVCFASSGGLVAESNVMGYLYDAP
jgi:hypothetical protein